MAKQASSGIKSFDRAIVRELAQRMTDLLKVEADKLGIDCERVAGKFDSRRFDFKCAFMVRGEKGESGAKLEWDAGCWRYGLKPDWFGKSFRGMGSSYTIVGLNTSRRAKYVVNATKDSDGRTYRFTAAVVVEAMRAAAVRAAA